MGAMRNGVELRLNRPSLVSESARTHAANLSRAANALLLMALPSVDYPRSRCFLHHGFYESGSSGGFLPRVKLELMRIS